MKAVFEKIRFLAKPYLNTRKNIVHTEIATEIAFKLIKAEGGEEDIVKGKRFHDPQMGSHTTRDNQ